MSSTYVHYGTPSSLPSDYALLSRYAATQPDAPAQTEASSVAPSDSNVGEEEDEDFGLPIHANGSNRPPTQRRGSSSNSYIPSFNPTMSPLPDEHGHRSGPHLKRPTENTPLLASPVPRIEEECDIVPDDGTWSSSNMFKEEMAILAKYTLPVFGYVHVFPSSPRLASHLLTCGYIGRTYSSTRSSWLLSSQSDTCPPLLSPPRHLAR